MIRLDYDEESADWIKSRSWDIFPMPGETLLEAYLSVVARNETSQGRIRAEVQRTLTLPSMRAAPEVLINELIALGCMDEDQRVLLGRKKS